MKSARPSLLTPTILIALSMVRVARADTVVQVPVDSLLDGRSVSTFTAMLGVFGLLLWAGRRRRCT